MVFSTVVTGKLLDFEFRRTKKKQERKQLSLISNDVEDGVLYDSEKRGDDDDKGRENKDSRTTKIKEPLDPNDLTDFPLEHARLRHQPICAFGFLFLSLHSRAHSLSRLLSKLTQIQSSSGRAQLRMDGRFMHIHHWLLSLSFSLSVSVVNTCILL